MSRRAVRRPGTALAVALIALALGGCAGALNLPESPRPSTYLVRRGDTLYSVAWHYGLDYQTVARWNGISPPYTIYPGQRIALYPRRAGSPQGHFAETPPAAAPGPPAPAAVSGESGGVSWRWPAQGTVRSTFGAQSLAGKGLVIEGHLGAPVRAAATGTVVYSGNALPGYGNLVIIKHNDEWLSAYGQNQRLLVHEGEQVRAGQKIATMGLAPDGIPELYFEIRHNGDPVDPLRFLPKAR